MINGLSHVFALSYTVPPRLAFGTQTEAGAIPSIITLSITGFTVAVSKYGGNGGGVHWVNFISMGY